MNETKWRVVLVDCCCGEFGQKCGLVLYLFSSNFKYYSYFSNVSKGLHVTNACKR